MLANFVLTYGCGTYLLRDYVPQYYNEYFMGLGCCLTWFGISRYIEYSGKHSIISRTVTHSMPDILRNTISSIPIFIGFAFLGITVFWNCWRFQEFNMACICLFGLMLGDEVGNTFAEVIQ
jgi:hypothetical protein